MEAVGTWGARWIGVLGEEDLDPKLLLWDMHRNVNRAAVPTPRTVLHFRFREVGGAQGRRWLVITPQEVDVCDEDPGHQATLTLTSGRRDLTTGVARRPDLGRAVGSGRLEVTGPERLRRECRVAARWHRPTLTRTPAGSGHGGDPRGAQQPPA